MKKMIVIFSKPKLLLLALLLSFSAMLPALKKESIGFVDFAAGFSEDMDINVNLIAGKDYYREKGVFAFGLERQIGFGMVNTEELTSLNASLMLGPVVGMRFDDVVISLSRTWGVTPAVFITNELNNKDVDLFFSNAWTLKTLFYAWDSDMFFDLSLFMAKPIPSQKTSYGIGVGVAWP